MKKIKRVFIVLMSLTVLLFPLSLTPASAKSVVINGKTFEFAKAPSQQKLIKAVIPWGNGVANAKVVLKFLKSKGFKTVSQNGSHVKLKGNSGKTVIVPNHGSKDIPKGTLNNILKQAGIKKK